MTAITNRLARWLAIFGYPRFSSDLGIAGVAVKGIIDKGILFDPAVASREGVVFLAFRGERRFTDATWIRLSGSDAQAFASRPIVNMATNPPTFLKLAIYVLRGVAARGRE